MKNILITGAANGIGKVTAIQLRDAGYAVYALDKVQVDETDPELRDIHWLHADLANTDDVNRVIESLADKPIHCIINNAAEIIQMPWETFDFDQWDRTIAANLTSPLRLVHGLRHSLNKESSIINMSSQGAHQGGYSNLAYTTTKAALISITKSLAANLGDRGIRVNAIAPGWVTTDSAKPFIPDETKEITPLGRVAEPSDIADTIMFLLSDKAKFINATTIEVDGGYGAIDYSLYLLNKTFSAKDA